MARNISAKIYEKAGIEKITNSVQSKQSDLQVLKILKYILKKNSVISMVVFSILAFNSFLFSYYQQRSWKMSLSFCELWTK